LNKKHLLILSLVGITSILISYFLRPDEKKQFQVYSSAPSLPPTIEDRSKPLNFKTRDYASVKQHWQIDENHHRPVKIGKRSYYLVENQRAVRSAQYRKEMGEVVAKIDYMIIYKVADGSELSFGQNALPVLRVKGKPGAQVFTGKIVVRDPEGDLQQDFEALGFVLNNHQASLGLSEYQMPGDFKMSELMELSESLPEVTWEILAAPLALK
jgi:hypothetical protein